METKEQLRKQWDEMHGRQWIPVSERLPENGSVVLAYYSKGSMETTVYANDGSPYGPWSCEGDEDIDFGNVTHWMPLPPPPAT